MRRADTARREQEGDIPYAQRTNPVTRLSPQRIKLLVFSSIFLIPLLILLISKFPFKNKTSVSVPLVNDGYLKDPSLLGHLPYQEVSDSDLVELYPGFRIHRDMFSDLVLMRDAAKRDGIYLVFLSGFRSVELQKEIFYENKSFRNQIAIERSKVSAPPGYSEHSTGYAIDIGDRYMRETDFEVEFEFTPAFRWLQKNAPKYHFVLSFPKGNPQKVSYEPWHWRYEGTVEALKQFEPANRKRIDLE